MVIITTLYLALVYLLFFRFHLLPWNKLSKGLTVLIGVVILSAFLVGLQGLTPASVRGAVTGRIVEIAPQVSGRVVSVSVEPDKPVDANAPLFQIDPVMFEARVEELEARLALARLRLGQYTELATRSAGTEFEVEQAAAEVEQAQALLKSANFDLENTIVRAPAQGIVPRLFLKPGMQVSPSRSVITFIDNSELVIGAQFQQKAVINVKAGDKALVNFPGIPGRVFEGHVIAVPAAIGNAQVLASGQLPSIEQLNMTRLFPVYIALPDDLPDNIRKVGMAASVTIHTEGAGVVGLVAVILQWISTSLDAVL